MFFYDNNKVKVDDVILPKMSVKPYIEYGIGLKKDWSESVSKDITSYAEVTRHSEKKLISCDKIPKSSS